MDVKAGEKYSINFGVLDEGEYTVNVTFKGNNNYKDSYSEASFSILKVTPAACVFAAVWIFFLRIAQSMLLTAVKHSFLCYKIICSNLR